MTDLEMTRICAMAIHDSLTPRVIKDVCWLTDTPYEPIKYDPLHDDAQAMELVKQCGMMIWRGYDAANFSEQIWGASIGTVMFPGGDFGAESKDLNRAIVTCVAKMEKAKAKQQ